MRFLLTEGLVPSSYEDSNVKLGTGEGRSEFWTDGATKSFHRVRETLKELETPPIQCEMRDCLIF